MHKLIVIIYLLFIFEMYPPKTEADGGISF